MEKAAQGIVRLDLGIDGIVSSPLTRCRETAAIVGDALGLEVDEDARLRPGAELDGLAELVAERSGLSRLLLCGHQPDMSGLAGELTGGMIEFRKGSLAVIEADALRPRAGVLRGLYPPAALRALGGG
jgi:phosphohistidine phosphatase